MATETLKSVKTPDGVTLRYVDTGAGDPPLVFVHGWCCSRVHWREQVPHFAKKHRVIALDQRGHGESDKPDQDYGIPGFVDDLALLIDEVGLRKPVIVGHSMGGAIAMNLARKHPELTRAIVMVDSPIVPLPANLQPLAQQIFAGLEGPGYQGVAVGFVRMQMFNPDSPAGLVDEVAAGMGSAPQRVMRTALENTLAPENETPGPIPVPALFIRAATAFATEEELRDRYPGLEVVTVGCAHFVQMEKPAETNALIERFVEGLA
jgi:pimeloyl-ACP methyl ester carboxylesterase